MLLFVVLDVQKYEALGGAALLLVGILVLAI
jgi:hypothetical protein